MGRHATEQLVARTVEVFARDLGMGLFTMTDGRGPDAVAVWRGKRVEFEIKAARARVTDRSKSGGTRPGRFRIDPSQHESYGTPYLFYVLVSYEDGDEGCEITQVRIIRSDYLPRRRAVISLSAGAVDAVDADEGEDE